MFGTSNMSGINKFLSKRERRPSVPPDKKPRLISGDLFGLFAADEKTKPSKDEEKKTKALSKRLSRLGITNLKESQIEYALRGDYSSGDPEKALELLVIIEDSIEGKIRRFDPAVRLLGAVNRQAVTCWLDALVFAMFARLDSFEAMLYNAFSDQPRQRLATMLRLWVNLLRSGKLITTDITLQLQEALAACGWKEAAETAQQDVSEAFTFITETLQLPHLTLKMDIYHTGKEDATDDHKFVNERLLEVAIPAVTEDRQTVTLEDCLETYFNNKIEVKRHLERRATTGSLPSIDTSKGYATHVESADLGSQPSTPMTPVGQDVVGPAVVATPGHSRDRSRSIIRERVIVEDVGASDKATGLSSRRRASIRKEVLMPAWQFFRLIPWYTDRAPTNDEQVAAHFSNQRPVLGLCLKRYHVAANGASSRLNTKVDIPLEIGLPHFIQDENPSEAGHPVGNFKLSLQSVVCHRGTSVDVGHYIALVRGQAQNAANASADVTDEDHSSSGTTDRWMRFDDLAGDRVTYVDIERALQEESPYLLFYQVQPIGGEPEPPPPPYSETMDDGTKEEGNGSAPGSARISGYDWSRKLDPAIALPENVAGRNSSSSDRRRSLAMTDRSGNGSVALDQTVTEPVTSNEDLEKGSAELTRRSSKAYHGPDSRDRSTNRAAEGRLSATFSRLTGRMGREKVDAPNEALLDGNLDVSKTEEVVPVEPVAEVKGKSKKEKKRGKSKVREGEVKRPDRECLVM
ncbi:MAG: hypothetical protein M1817_006407 [Caeruleum heppii]|nr:MAG: hypothetical protein M1817_006407 [Caeruleum heppii]